MFRSRTLFEGLERRVLSLKLSQRSRINTLEANGVSVGFTKASDELHKPVFNLQEVIAELRLREPFHAEINEYEKYENVSESVRNREVSDGRL